MIEKAKNILLLIIVSTVIFDGIGDIMTKLLRDSIIIDTTSKPEIKFKVIKEDTIWFYKFNK